jgi:hypothetical protein
MTGAQFREHLYQLALSRHEIAAFADVSVRTADRGFTLQLESPLTKTEDGCIGLRGKRVLAHDKRLTTECGSALNEKPSESAARSGRRGAPR